MTERFVARQLSDAEILNELVFVEDLSGHFEAFQAANERADFLDVAAEGSRVIGLLLGEKVEDFSSLDSVIHGVAAASHLAAVAAVARMLGVPREALDDAFQDFLDKEHGGFVVAELVDLVNEHSRRFREHLKSLA